MNLLRNDHTATLLIMLRQEDNSLVFQTRPLYDASIERAAHTRSFLQRNLQPFTIPAMRLGVFSQSHSGELGVSARVS